MIRVLVVEDEPPILRAVKTAIERADNRFSVVHTAINGKKALEILAIEKIDVVFTDIRMPIMDGLVLSEEIHENYPDIFVVITSGFSDFEYARRAIAYNVYDYILKPVSSQKISATLSKLADKIYENRREKVKNKLLSGESTEEISDSQCSVFTVCAGAVSLLENDVMSPSNAFWDKTLPTHILDTILRDSETYIEFPGKLTSERVLVVEHVCRERGQNIANQLMENLKNDNIAITIIWGSDIAMDELGKVIQKMRDLLVSRVILTKSQIINISEPFLTETPPLYTTLQIEELSLLISSGKHEDAEKYLLNIFSEFEKGDITQNTLTDFLNMLENHTRLVNPKLTTNIKNEILSTVLNFSGYINLASEVVSVLSESSETVAEKQPKLISDIEDYIKTNYRESITNSVLSKEFGFVPSYISRQFRKYKDVSPGEYLTKLRIQKAKELMLSNSELMIKEIADMVGFKDAYYFSKTFKKETGKWPTEYLK